MRSDTALRRWKLVTEARMLSPGAGEIVKAGNDLADALTVAEAERDALHDLAWRTKDTLVAAITGEADDGDELIARITSTGDGSTRHGEFLGAEPLTGEADDD